MNYWPTRANIARSLREGTDSKTRWYPVPIRTWHATLGALQYNGTALVDELAISQNVAYSLQYLEYLQQTLVELSLSDVLERQSIKIYIITAIGIIECLLYHLNRVSGGTEANLSKIIERVGEKGLLGKAKKPYDDLHRFRELRNKVHIKELRDELGTDYQSFGRREFAEIRRLMLDLLQTSSFGLSQDKLAPFRFLARKVWSDDA